MTVTRTEMSMSAVHDSYKARKVLVLLVMSVTNTEGSRSAGHDCYKDTKVQVCWS